ncbi:hypothetical protein Sjap_008459 [Stephania japonica]|uniref:Biopterin transport-related protein BT1 n=1 Tax=Stephania japonica TaxID=461633 RepID=A0AAP0JRT7_9MAGN
MILTTASITTRSQYSELTSASTTTPKRPSLCTATRIINYPRTRISVTLSSSSSSSSSPTPNKPTKPIKPNATPRHHHLHKLKGLSITLPPCDEAAERSSLGVGVGVGGRRMLVLCGLGYWVQGLRCFPWLALDFHMAGSMRLTPSLLQLLQSFGCLPVVAKPFYGVLSDALYIGSAHRLPYISLGVLLQIISWGLLALLPFAGERITTLMACILVSNLGASISEVASDALVAEYGKKRKVGGLQAYSFMALAAGGIVGNLFGGYFLLKTAQPKSLFLIFTLLLSLQLAVSSSTREDSLGLPCPPKALTRRPIVEILGENFSSLIKAIRKERIFFPLCWVASSIAFVPILSGTMFCYQTQFLNLNASVIGLSKVTGQLVLLFATVIYERHLKKIPMSTLIGTVQIMYAASLLLDLVLVKQINLRVGVSNETFTLYLSGLAETISQFKLLPFTVLFASLCPPGCEGTLTSFLASALCLSSIVSGLLGVGLASLIGVSYGDYSNLQFGIMLQFLAALVPLGWLSFLPRHHIGEEERQSRIRIKRSQKGT